MTSVVNGNLWIYFAHTDVHERVICKICKKSLLSKRSFNLRKHLKHSHKIEVVIIKKYKEKLANKAKVKNV